MKLIVTIVLAFVFGAAVSAYGQTMESTIAVVSSIQEEPEALEITLYGNRIQVNNAPVGAILEVYSIVGLKVKEIVIRQPNAEYVVDIAKGFYIVRVGNVVRKVVIR